MVRSSFMGVLLSSLETGATRELGVSAPGGCVRSEDNLGHWQALLQYLDTAVVLKSNAWLSR